MPPPTVFISHSTSDQPVVLRLIDFLERTFQGAIRFFVAGRDLPPGTEWEQEILSALKNADLVLAVFSPKAMDSNFVVFETGYARGLGKRVIPIGLPGQLVKDIPRPVGSLQGYDLHNPDGVSRLITALNQIFEHRHPEAVTISAFQQIVSGGIRNVDTPKPGNYRVYSVASGVEREHEAVEIVITGDRMTARTTDWFSTGFLLQNRYVGRFKYLRGSSPSNVGTHELQWTGSQFEGKAQPDSQKWINESLIWRPE